MSRKKLQLGLDEISSLILKVVNEQNFGVRFDNPYLKRCYEVAGCKKKSCLSYGKDASRCWQISGTFCGGITQGNFVDKYGACHNCPVFKEAVSEPIYQIGEYFNNMMHILERKNKELEKAYNDLKEQSVRHASERKNGFYRSACGRCCS